MKETQHRWKNESVCYMLHSTNAGTMRMLFPWKKSEMVFCAVTWCSSPCTITRREKKMIPVRDDMLYIVKCLFTFASAAADAHSACILPLSTSFTAFIFGISKYFFFFFFHKPPTSEFQPDSRQLWNPLFACIINYHPLFSIQKDHQLCTAERRIVLVPEVVTGLEDESHNGKRNAPPPFTWIRSLCNNPRRIGRAGMARSCPLHLRFLENPSPKKSAELS